MRTNPATQADSREPRAPTSVGFILFAHGSRLEAANEAVRKTAGELARAGNLGDVRVAFLDCAPPSLEEVVSGFVQDGIRRIIVLPYFLTAGRHSTADLPMLADQLRAKYPGLELRVAETLDGHPALIQALLDRARAAADSRGE